MPFTEKQRRLMNAAANDPAVAREHGMSGRTAERLAGEANRMRKQGRERPAVKAESSPGVVVVDLAPVFDPTLRRR